MNSKVSQDLWEQLNRTYLCLVDLYLQLDDGSDSAQQILTQLEIRLEQMMEHQSTFQIMSELGNTLRKHNQLELAVQLYKKSLLSLKHRFKNNYLQQRETSKIIINIASTEFIRNNLAEAMRYYEHAVLVLNQTKTSKDSDEMTDITRLMDLAKVYVSLGQILK